MALTYIVKRVVGEDPMEKRPLGRLKLRWKDWVNKDIKKIEPEIRWKGTAEDRVGWQDLWYGLKGQN